MLCRFLEYVVEETIAGRVNEIKEYTIGTRALGRPGISTRSLTLVYASMRAGCGRCCIRII